MKNRLPGYGWFLLPACFLLACTIQLRAQTDMDGIMMKRMNFCTGFAYSYNTWDHYWEGTLKRTNENLGNVSTQMIGWMGSYGLTDRLNLNFSIPYVKTRASAGTLHGIDGIQDLSLSVKWEALRRNLLSGNFRLMAVGGFSFPVSNYVADYQPLAIGLRSRNLSFRAIGDFEKNHFFVTGSAAYVYRSNIRIDRDAYYTTELHLSHDVQMPDAANFQLRAGYRGKQWGGELLLTNWTTLGGFDITRNNMPFPSNRMNATMAGIGIKCNPNALPGFGIMAGGGYTLAGRNMGQAIMVSGAITYVFDFTHREKK